MVTMKSSTESSLMELIEIGGLGIARFDFPSTPECLGNDSRVLFIAGLISLGKKKGRVSNRPRPFLRQD